MSQPSLFLDQFGQFFKSSERTVLSLSQKMLGQKIEAGLKKVEKRLYTQLNFTDELAETSTRYLMNAGGKRVRPALVLLISQLGDGATDDVLTAAQVIELTHLATLYHDDVMDEAELRRGVDAVHKVWGNSVAILAGDLLFARASSMLISLGLNALQIQAKTFERLCLGQLNETVGPKAGEDAIAHYLQVLSDKTGSLLGAAAQMGLIFSNGPLEYEQALVDYGENVGVAFQLADDVIDLSAESDKTGKAAGNDLRSGVETMPILKLRVLAEQDASAADLLQRLGNPDNKDVFEVALDELRNHEVTRLTLVEAKKFADRAREAIAILPDGDVKQSLETFAVNMAEREG
ncbi:MAG: polyprenyl synthetase family protein [Microbacteriaceae bacterium]